MKNSTIMQCSVLLGAAVMLMLVQQGSAIRCFECNSYNDTRCAKDNPPQEMSVECSSRPQPTSGKPYTFCRKIRQNIEFSINGLPAETRYIRTCGWDDSSSKNACYKRSGSGSRQDVCACYEDNCNAAGSVQASLLFASVAAIVAGVFAM